MWRAEPAWIGSVLELWAPTPKEGGKVRRLHRSVTDFASIRGKTYRFVWMKDVTGHTIVTAEKWDGWKWVRIRFWEGNGNVAQ